MCVKERARAVSSPDRLAGNQWVLIDLLLLLLLQNNNILPQNAIPLEGIIAPKGFVVIAASSSGFSSFFGVEPTLAIGGGGPADR